MDGPLKPRRLVIATPLRRRLAVVFDGEQIVSSEWLEAGSQGPVGSRGLPTAAVEVTRQVAAYFAGKLPVFDLPLRLVGSAFNVHVWRIIGTLPFGATASYGEVARVAGSPGAHRAVARAMRELEFALFVPAHRVIGADGKIKGADPESMRVRLLEFETTQSAGDASA